MITFPLLVLQYTIYFSCIDVFAKCWTHRTRIPQTIGLHFCKPRSTYRNELNNMQSHFNIGFVRDVYFPFLQSILYFSTTELNSNIPWCFNMYKVESPPSCKNFSSYSITFPFLVLVNLCKKNPFMCIPHKTLNLHSEL